MRTLYFDTETYPIRSGLVAPKMVCLQFAYDDDEPRIVLRNEAHSILRAALEDDEVKCEAFNSAFDWAVICAAFEDLIQLVFRKLAKFSSQDSLILYKLRDIMRGRLADRKGWYRLGNILQRELGIELDKGEESWQTKYALLDGQDPATWPALAIKYAKEDITGLRALSKHLRSGFTSPDEGFQCAAAFVLQLCAVWGVRVDPVKLSWVEFWLLALKQDRAEKLTAAGLMFDGKVSKKAVQAEVVKACGLLSKPVVRTEPTEKMLAKGKTEGNIRTNAETLEDLITDLKFKLSPDKLPPLVALGEHDHAVHIHSTYILPMRDGIQRAMTSAPNVLVASGRTSWRGGTTEEKNPWWQPDDVGAVIRNGTSLQIFPTEEGIRDCIVPRPGMVFSSTDYSALELRTLAQACLWTVGHSTLAEGFKKDPDWDPHSYFAGHLTHRSYEEAMKLYKGGDKEFGHIRKIAKNLNFALPGGVGAKKFQWMAKQAEIDLSLDQCYFYKQEWLDAFPEMQSYFDYFSWVANNKKTFKQFVSRRIRGDLGYCDGCNTPFQGLGGDISKYALFLVSMACYAEPKSPLFRSRPVVLVHDEIIAEHPAEIASEANLEVMRLMCLAEERFLPDVPARAEPTLMTRWLKAAKPKWKDGWLVPWDA